ncbi:MAG: 2-phosphosulfolactate phosphatase [Pseudomonadota bacterium]
MNRFVGTSDCHDIRGTAVVIDVLRAFTVAPLAISRGAREIVLVESLEAALHLKSSTPNSLAFKDGPPQDGFDLFNSPGHLLNLNVEDRTIYQKTTAGTRAALAAKQCVPLLCSSFVCASATASYLRELGQSVTYVISGEDGQAIEDMAAAQFIDALLTDPNTDPSPFIEAAGASNAANELRKGLELGYLGVDKKDISICLDVDRFDFCLVAVPGPNGMVLRPAR